MDNQAIIEYIIMLFIAPIIQYYITEFLTSRKAAKSSSITKCEKSMNLFEKIKQNTPKQKIIFEFFLNLTAGILFMALAIVFIFNGVDDFVKSTGYGIGVSLPCFVFAVMTLTNTILFFLAAISDAPND